jgi:hypothetical protein
MSDNVLVDAKLGALVVAWAAAHAGAEKANASAPRNARAT